MRTYFTFAIFILFAIGSYWLLQDTNRETLEDRKSAERFPDYFMENFSITNLDLKGQPETVLKAKKMLHYADDDSAELQQPEVKVNRKDNTITLQADRATFFKQKNLLHLYDNVIIHRSASKTQSELFIYTEYLKIDITTHIAETDKAAKVKTPEAQLNSMGLKFDSLKGTLKLPSKVKGIYEAAH